ncbi:MAG: glycosyltransferase family 2 protein [Opitutales bacterium]
MESRQSGSSRSVEGVTVLVPAFNAMPYLEFCIESILCQTYVNFELLILNDGSTDETEVYLNGHKDDRIRIVTKENEGFVKTLNLGLKLASYNWVARIDADDAMAPFRLEKQVEFLEKHPEYRAVSSNYGFLNSQNKKLGIEKRIELEKPPRFHPVHDPNILHAGILYNRKDVLSVGGYREVVPAEDLDLWLRMYPEFPIAHQREVLTYVRILTEGISSGNYIKQRAMWSYVKDCDINRRSGLNEEPYEEWIQRNKAIIDKKRRKWNAGRLVRSAGMEWARRGRIRCMIYLLGAFWYSPLVVIEKIASYRSRNV